MGLFEILKNDQKANTSSDFYDGSDSTKKWIARLIYKILSYPPNENVDFKYINKTLQDILTEVKDTDDIDRLSNMSDTSDMSDMSSDSNLSNESVYETDFADCILEDNSFDQKLCYIMNFYQFTQSPHKVIF